MVYDEVYCYCYLYYLQSLDLASDFGGILGLWAGFTVITAVEVLEFIIILCMVSCRKLVCSSSTKIKPLDVDSDNKHETKLSAVNSGMYKDHMGDTGKLKNHQMVISVNSKIYTFDLYLSLLCIGQLWTCTSHVT